MVPTWTLTKTDFSIGGPRFARPKINKLRQLVYFLVDDAVNVCFMIGTLTKMKQIYIEIQLYYSYISSMH